MNVVGLSTSSAIRAANAWVAGLLEFSIAPSCESNSTIVR